MSKPGYSSWRSMIARCHDERHDQYKRYGMRGIVVCPRWRDSFDNFFADMGAPPRKGYSIDRIDNDKGYFKSNCRWSTAKEQARNRRNNRSVIIDGSKKLLVEIAEESKIDVNILYARTKAGWTNEYLSIPLKKRNKRLISIGNETKTIAEWSAISGISKSLIGRRLWEGWDNHEAVFLPLFGRYGKSNGRPR